MATSTHPQAEELDAYTRDPGLEDYRQLRLHLAVCPDCRQQVDILTSLQRNLHEIQARRFAEAVSEDGAFSHIMDEQLIERYVDGELEAEQRDSVAGYINDNAMAMKAALHYASHGNQMKIAFEKDGGEIYRKDTHSRGPVGLENSNTSRSSRFHCLKLRYPVWLTVPLTAVCAGLLTAVILPQTRLVETPTMVVAYQDNPVMQFRKAVSAPGIGFFSGATKTSRPYANITVRPLNGALSISWPKVDKAESYTMQLKIFIEGKQLLLDTIKSTGNSATFKRAANDSGHRYVWKLTGKTRNGDLFSSRGGFIISSDSH